MSKRVPYRFRTDIDVESLDGILTNFLRSKNAAITEKEKVIGATRAYWLPFALKEKGEYSDEQLKQYARAAIYKLRMHINYLAENFGLLDEGEQAISNDKFLSTKSLMPRQPATAEKLTSVLAPPASKNKLGALDLVEQVEPCFTSSTETQAEYTPDDFIYHQDDDTFQEMFS
ncbi:hypothetical protein FNW02_37825 [Komarekiella sp. 'clone 1']|uniref:Uncharacterized protein n=1 Tax=Komarekiella delphini-convector SJRDD-AB1 TaxID=2593771 RepID=A0AA41BAP0_9NOST|nr:hypothetical protein [Komarekiella delphini-convector]MBD6621294.1 hypothetical protein [Komarekiella delphini-convector SJRDD-AB1]